MDLVARIRGKVGAVRQAMATAASGVEEIRAANAALRAEREAVRGAPVPLDEARAALDKMLTTWATVGQARGVRVDHLIAQAMAGHPPATDELYRAASLGTVFSFLVPLLREELRGGIEKALTERYAEVREGLPRDRAGAAPGRARWRDREARTPRGGSHPGRRRGRPGNRSPRRCRPAGGSGAAGMSAAPALAKSSVRNRAGDGAATEIALLRPDRRGRRHRGGVYRSIGQITGRITLVVSSIGGDFFQGARSPMRSAAAAASPPASIWPQASLR